MSWAKYCIVLCVIITAAAAVGIRQKINIRYTKQPLPLYCTNSYCCFALHCETKIQQFHLNAVRV